MELWLFYLFGGIALVAAIGVVMLRRVFYSALALIVCLGSMAGIYMLLDAPFIAAVQVIVYAGAVMVLFLFVIMLLDPFSGPVHSDKKRYLAYLGVALGVCIMVLLYPLLAAFDVNRTPRSPEMAAGGPGNIGLLARTLFSDFLLPFEVTSILILIAIIGAVVLAKRQT